MVLGAEGRIEFTRYDSELAFAAARAGHDDLMFLTGREMVENGLAAQVIPGPAVFIETTSAIVQADAPYQHLQELAGKPICFALGPHAQYHLQAWFAARHLSFIPMAFQEDVEMNDAYKVRYCHALAGETTTLAETAHSPEMAKTRHRFLPETLAAYPILAASSTSDGEFAAIVAWSLATLQRADAPDSQWARGGFASLPVEAPALGLGKGWQERLVALMGSYQQLYEKNLGATAGLALPPGFNRALTDGGGFVPPHVD